MRPDAREAARRAARAARLLRQVTGLALAVLVLTCGLVGLGVLGSTVLLAVVGYCLGSLLVALAVFARVSMKTPRRR